MYSSQPENKTVWIYLKSLVFWVLPTPLALPPQSHRSPEFGIYRLFAFFKILSLLSYVGINNIEYLARFTVLSKWYHTIHLLQLALLTQHCVSKIYLCGHICLQLSGSMLKMTDY